MDAWANRHVVDDLVFVLIAGQLSAAAAADAAEDIEANADSKDSDKFLSIIGFVILIGHAKHFLSDVGVAHRLEHRQADVEPDVESGKCAAEISAKLEALLPASYSHGFI